MWIAPAGSSLLASFVLRGGLEHHAVLPLAAAVAVCEAGERTAPVTCGIKWPNDVWVDGRKLAGILLEGRPQEGWTVLGIGVNVARWADRPPELAETATSLEEAAADATGVDDAPPVDVESVLRALVEALGARLKAKDADNLAAWRARDALLGETVRWDGGEGVAEGIDDAGALIVASDGGQTALHAGEVRRVRPVGRGA